MKRIALFILILTASLSQAQEGHIQPDGYWWNRVSPLRQLGYVEGFNAGSLGTNSVFCSDNDLKNPLRKNSEACISYNWQQKTLLEVDTTKTLDTITRLYSEPRNVCIRWNHAVVIAEAMVSGVKVTDEQLDVIREFDAKLTAAK